MWSDRWMDRMYYYPVQETFRYHFMDSPRPYRHEPSNVKGIMKRGNPFQDRSASRLSPMDGPGRQNERAELDYRVAPDTVLADAPFGTMKTPSIQMRIVGGRYIPVIEQQPRFKDEYVDRRIQPLNPITLAPQHTDPRNSLDVNYYKDAQPTALINKRPDSKDIARLQFRALPPIQSNRTRNDMSTVFEAEPWTRNKQPSLARETEYKQNYNPQLDDDNAMEFHQHQHRPSGTALHVSKEEEQELLKTLPRNVLLPVDAIKLTREQEHTACKLAAKDLTHFDPKELRDVYIECSQHDKDLVGCCSIEVLDNTLRRHRAHLSDTLRIIAAQFVDPRQPGKVNYEKVLSFIGSALEMHRKGQLSDDKPRYFMQNGDDGVKTGSIYKDREVAKLLRMVEQELSKCSYYMDWTKWQNLFFERDRDHRETLSAPQIKDICYDCNLPLSDSLVNQILNLCEDNNRDGQYRWHAFLDFLNRVRPSNTGLPIPVSKRPLEYAKHYPAPVANWPRTDTDAVERRDGFSPRRSTSPRRGEYYKQEPQQQQYDEREKSPQREIPSSRGQKERQEKTETIDRRMYSPDKNAYRNDRPVQPMYESPRAYDHDLSPSPAFEQYRASVEPRDYNRSGDEFRQHRDEHSGGYKPSWHEKDQGRAESPRKWAQAPERDRQREAMSPKWTQAPDREKQEPMTNHYHGDHHNHKDRQYQDVVRFRYRDPYDRAMHAWAQPDRPYNSYRVPSRLNRPKSYAEPQRYEQQQYGVSPSMQRHVDDHHHRRPDRPSHNREEQIHHLSKELEQLQSKHNLTRESLKQNEKPWLDRYLKLAQALYNIDMHNSGCLPRNDVMDIVRQYNDAYNLRLDMSRANMLAISPENIDRSGNVLLRPYLACLCGDNFKERI